MPVGLEDIADLQEAMALSRKELRLRVIAIAVFALTALPLVGGRVALVWAAASLAMAVGVGAVLDGWGRRRLDPRLWLVAAVGCTSLSYTVMGSLALAASLTHGAWGLLSAEALMFCLVLFASREGGRSVLAFYGAIAPLAVYMVGMAAFALAERAPWQSALSLGLGTVLVLVNAERFSPRSRRPDLVRPTQTQAQAPEAPPDAQRTDFDLRQALAEALRAWRAEARRRGKRLRLTGSRAVHRWVSGDPARLRQIIDSLVSHGLTFTEAGSVSLSLAIAPLEGGRVRLRVLVIDAGPSLDEDQLERLFGFSRELARTMGGDLTAESAPGRQAAFRLAVPLDMASAPAASGLRVLIADDDQVNRQAFALMLDAISSEVCCVEDGAAALDALSASAFDVMLIDVEMPGLGGLEAVRRLRAGRGPNRRTPVFALTASVTPEQVDACLASGVDVIVSMPVEAQELIAAIGQVLGASARAAAAPLLKQAV